MANKISFRKGDVGDHYEPSDSENEYTEREKQLLAKVRKGRQRTEDPKKAILQFDQNDDDDEDEEGLFPTKKNREIHPKKHQVVLDSLDFHLDQSQFLINKL